MDILIWQNHSRMYLLSKFEHYLFQSLQVMVSMFQDTLRTLSSGYSTQHVWCMILLVLQAALTVYGSLPGTVIQGVGLTLQIYLKKALWWKFFAIVLLNRMEFWLTFPFIILPDAYKNLYNSMWTGDWLFFSILPLEPNAKCWEKSLNWNWGEFFSNCWTL